MATMMQAQLSQEDIRRKEASGSSSIASRVKFDFVRYANCWEDGNTLVQAFNGHNKSRYLSIASAGDNTLALLTLDPELVVAVDLSPAQLACLEIRMAAFAAFTYNELLAFLGFQTCSGDRWVLYKTLRQKLGRDARRFWDRQPEVIRKGIVHAGKFERYLRLFGQRLLPLIHSRQTIETLRREKSVTERIVFYERQWNTWRWRLLFRLFFGRYMLGYRGRDPEFLRFAEGPVADRILDRVRFGLTRLPTHENPYLEYILTGRFQRALPFYVQEKNHKRIKNRLDRIRLFRGTAAEAVRTYGGYFDGFNLSDIFEYMDENLFRQTAEILIDHAHPGAKLVYWNLLAQRRIAPLFAAQVACNQVLSDRLFRNDLAFFYQSFFVDEVK